MITLAILEQRLNELNAGREQLISQIMQAQANVNAFAGAIEEVTRLRDLAAASTGSAGSPTGSATDTAPAPEPHEGVN